METPTGGEPASGRPRTRRAPVVRADGRRVRVPRLRGQLLVCATGCCCGRPQQGHPQVPVDLYHAEWERRGLRDVVHLTIGGCLGPCVLANVVLLLLDGRALAFHSMNADGAVLALYDHLDAMLAAGVDLALPPGLARLHFVPFDWPALAARPALR